MATARKAQITYESGVTPHDMQAFTDTGDHKRYGIPDLDFWSLDDASAPDIRPDGVVNGFAITPAVSGLADAVDVASGAVYIGGRLIPVIPKLDLVIDRGTTDSHLKSSIVVNDAGVITAIDGAEHTAFSEVRAADGGPPLIPVGSVELGQVHLTSLVSAAVDTNAIRQLWGIHQERADYPQFVIDAVNGKVEFESPLPANHTAGVTKAVHGQVAEPILSELIAATDFVPPAVTYSVASTQYYDRTIAAQSEGLQAGGFSFASQTGVTDTVLTRNGRRTWIRFKPNRMRPEHLLCNGVLGFSHSFPPASNITITATIAAEEAAVMRAI